MEISLLIKKQHIYTRVLKKIPAFFCLATTDTRQAVGIYRSYLHTPSSLRDTPSNLEGEIPFILGY